MGPNPGECIRCGDVAFMLWGEFIEILEGLIPHLDAEGKEKLWHLFQLTTNTGRSVCYRRTDNGELCGKYWSWVYEDPGCPDHGIFRGPSPGQPDELPSPPNAGGFIPVRVGPNVELSGKDINRPLAERSGGAEPRKGDASVQGSEGERE